MGWRGLGGEGALGGEGLWEAVEDVEAAVAVGEWLGFGVGGGFGRRVWRREVGWEGEEGELFALPLEIE